MSQNPPAAEMPKYKCHKVVSALKIKEFTPIKDIRDGVNVTYGKLFFEDRRFEDVSISPEMFSRYVPVPGDYYVQYEDGYRSISPQKVFEEGYTPQGPLYPVTFSAPEKIVSFVVYEGKLAFATEHRIYGQCPTGAWEVLDQL